MHYVSNGFLYFATEYYCFVVFKKSKIIMSFLINKNTSFNWWNIYVGYKNPKIQNGFISIVYHWLVIAHYTWPSWCWLLWSLVQRLGAYCAITNKWNPNSMTELWSVYNSLAYAFLSVTIFKSMFDFWICIPNVYNVYVYFVN